MKQWIRLAVWLIPAVAFVHACGGSATTDSTSGNTNWLKLCDVQADCGEGLSCRCNTCQQTCTVSTDCTIADPGSRCAAPSDEMQCGDAPATTRLCVKSCDVSSDCERDDLVCIQDACVRRGSVADGGNIADSGSHVDAGNISVGGGDATDETCVQPNIEIVMPRSGGMTRAFDGKDLWTVVRDALIEPAVGALPQFESRVRFGLTLYGNPEDLSTAPQGLLDAGDAASAPGPGDLADAGVCPAIIDVPIRSNNYESIQFAFTDVEPIGSSPMAEGIHAAAIKLISLTAPGPKVIVLVAPGDPDSCFDPDSNGMDPPRQAAIAAVEDARQDVVNTVVVALDTDDSNAVFFQQLASAGAINGPLAEYYAPANADQMSATLEAIFQNWLPECAGR